MPTIRATGNRDPHNRCVRGFMTRHNRGVGIILAKTRFARSASGAAAGCSQTPSTEQTRAPTCTLSSSRVKRIASTHTDT